MARPKGFLSKLRRKKRKKAKKNQQGSISRKLKNILQNKIIGKVKAAAFRKHVKDNVGINLKESNNEDVMLVTGKEKPNRSFFFRDESGPKVLVERKNMPIDEMNVDADIHKLKQVKSQNVMRAGEQFPRMILVTDTAPMSRDEAKAIAKQVLEGGVADKDVNLKVAVRLFQGEDGKFHYRFRVLTPNEVNLMQAQRENLEPARQGEARDMAVLDASKNAESETTVSVNDQYSKLPPPQQIVEDDNDGVYDRVPPIERTIESEEAAEGIYERVPPIERTIESEEAAGGIYERVPPIERTIESEEAAGGVYERVPPIERTIESDEAADGIYHAFPLAPADAYGTLELIPPPPELPADPNYGSLQLIPHVADGDTIYDVVDFSPPPPDMADAIYDVVNSPLAAATNQYAAVDAPLADGGPSVSVYDRVDEVVETNQYAAVDAPLDDGGGASAASPSGSDGVSDS